MIITSQETTLTFESLKTTLGHGFESHHLHRYPGGGVMLPPAFCVCSIWSVCILKSPASFFLSAHLFKRAWESWSAMRDRRRGNSERGRFRQVRGKDRMNGSGKCHTCHPCFEQIAKKSGIKMWNEPKSEESRNKTAWHHLNFFDIISMVIWTIDPTNH